MGTIPEMGTLVLPQKVELGHRHLSEHNFMSCQLINDYLWFEAQVKDKLAVV
jgi:hypothetical protein